MKLNKTLFEASILFVLCGIIVCTDKVNEVQQLGSHTLYQFIEEKTNITKTPRSVYGGGSVLFTCLVIKTTNVFNESDYTVQWVRNAQTLTSNGSYRITQESSYIGSTTVGESKWYEIWYNSTLLIRTVTSDDQGIFCCYITERYEQCLNLNLAQEKPKGKSSNKDIYEASMIALACFMITIIGLFVLFMCNRSFFRRRSPGNETERRTSDLFNVGAELAAMRHIDKPPTYEQVVSQDRVVRGMPPPSYNDVSVDAALPIAIDSSRARHGRHRGSANGHRPLTRIATPSWPSERENSNPAVLDVTSFSRITLIHAGRRGAVRYQGGRPHRRRTENHVELRPTASETQRAASLAGSVNSAFVSDA